ncbi:phasin family protein [Oceanibacterium hippocampi]|uniref:Phasin protein n=1 Tax=Oceanibacterium hippocampi TaxID=745714 RepID=A0A1Y5RVA8_9PROT|nr:phasin family protein [Oceanibacterium hippocampi]SLN26347.1 Phasin protein [Oceanibacterium hippocampi]
MANDKAKTATGAIEEMFPFAANMTAAFPGNEGAIKAWVEMNRTIAQGMYKFSEETTRFMAQRMEDDLERQQEIMACKSPEEFWKAYKAFADKAAEDYSHEAEKILSLATEMQTACAHFGDNLRDKKG